MRPTSFLGQLRADVPRHLLKVVDYVWDHRDRFLRWPERGDRCFMLGCNRTVKNHSYTARQLRQLRKAQIRVDGRANGPAIMAFLLAGGERPQRLAKPRGWAI